MGMHETFTTTKDATPPGVSWWQYVYGKLVVSADGPIVDRFEYANTGRSPGLPKALVKFCFPAKVGIAAEDHCGDYPWPKGGIVLRSICQDGTWYQFAACIRQRPERGEGMQGRPYTQAMYLVALQSKVKNIALLDLLDILRATPMVEGDSFDLNDVITNVTPRAQKALIANWETIATEYLVPLLCGKTVSVEEPSGDLEGFRNFYKAAMVCLAMLPEEVRWQLPIGVGMVRTTGVALGHGITAVGQIRKVGNVWNGLDGLDASLKKKAAFYIDQIKTTLRDRSPTLEALSTAADQIAKRYFASRECKPNTDKIPSAPWQEDTVRLIESVWKSRHGEQVLKYISGNLPTYLADGVSKEMRQVCDGDRSRILLRIAKNLRKGQHLSESLTALISTRDASWRTAWQDAIADTDRPDNLEGLSFLFGPEGVAPINLSAIHLTDTFELTKNLPETERRRVYNRLLDKVIFSSLENPAYGDWTRLIEASDDSTNWLKVWRKKSEPYLRLCVIRLYISGGLLDRSVKNRILGEPLIALLKGSHNNASEYLRLLKELFPSNRYLASITKLHAAAHNEFCTYLSGRGRHAEAILIAKRLKQDRFTTTRVCDANLPDTSPNEVVKDIAEFIGNIEDPGELEWLPLIEDLLLLWQHFPQESGTSYKKVIPRIVDKTGSGLFFLITGTKVSRKVDGTSRGRMIAMTVIRKLIDKQDPGVRKRLTQQITIDSSREQRELLWYFAIVSQDVTTLLRFALDKILLTPSCHSNETIIALFKSNGRIADKTLSLKGTLSLINKLNVEKGGSQFWLKVWKYWLRVGNKILSKSPAQLTEACIPRRGWRHNTLRNDSLENTHDAEKLFNACLQQCYQLAYNAETREDYKHENIKTLVEMVLADDIGPRRSLQKPNSNLAVKNPPMKLD